MYFHSLTFIFVFVPLVILLTALARQFTAGKAVATLIVIGVLGVALYVTQSVFLASGFPILLAIGACVITLILSKIFSGVQLATCVLVIASIIFYASGPGYPAYIFVLLLSGSIVINYLISGFIDSAEGRQRYWITAFSIILNLALLAYFKYTNFFINNVNAFADTGFSVDQIILPAGISFFTFQQIAYATDTYGRKIEKRDFGAYALFVAFFPQLIAGPIVHHGQIIKQYAHEQFGKINWENILIGIGIFGIGLFSKKILADNFAVYADEVFNLADNSETGAISFVTAWKGSLAYTFQIYFDFAGYSTMAIGLGRMFGVKLPVNFFSPYKSTSIIEFWRRWHITLSTFLKDYLYIAMGGNRKGKSRRWFNLMATMVLGGLWHGSSWNFVIWGTLHGIYLVINHMWNMLAKAVPWISKLQQTLLWSIIGWALTFFAVVLAWVGFRAKTLEGNLSVVKGLVGGNGFENFMTEIAALDLKFWAFIAAGFFASLALPNMAQIFGKVRATYEETEPGKVLGLIKLSYKPNILWTLILAIITAIAVFYQPPTTAFIYWQF